MLDRHDGGRPWTSEGFNVIAAPDGTSLIVHVFGEEQDWLVDPVTRTARPTDYGSTFGVSWQRRGG